MNARLRSCAATALRQAQGRPDPSTRLRVALRPSKGEQRRGTARQTGRIAVITAAAILIGGSSSVFACPVCFGAEETAMIDATKLGIVVLLSITIAVQGAFVGFFVYLRKRAKRMAEVDLDTEWSQLQRGPSRTS